MRVFSNNSSSLIASGIIAGDGQVTLSSGEGALFPSPTGTDYCVCTLEDVAGNLEIVHMTARSGDICTITRAREGTTARAFASGSRFELRVTKGVLDSLLQKDGDSITGPITLTGGGYLSGGRYQNGEIVNSPIRGASADTSNQLVVPSGGLPPTIAGNVIYHAGNLTRSVVGGILFPTGVVVMWNGTPATVPTGWALCDGTNGTPNLRDRFIVGAGSTYALGAVGGATTASTGSSGTHDHVVQGTSLTIAQMPTHSHRLIGLRNPIGASGSYTIWTVGTDGPGSYYAADDNSGNKMVENTGSGDPHTHSISGDGSHSHTVSTLPPYHGLYFIMKL